MKKILLLLAVLFLLIGCVPVRRVNVNSRHNYYERHRSNTYTSPTWIPGIGIVLETHIYRSSKRSYAPRVRRGRHK
jgi:uncharacterized protein YceK